MLQHDATAARSLRNFYEDIDDQPTKQAPKKGSKTPQFAPDLDPLMNRVASRTAGKKAPTANGKSPNDDASPISRVERAPKASPKPPTVIFTTTTTTTTVTPTTTTPYNETIPDFGDDETVSKNIELSIKPTLEEINLGPNGPLERFSETFRTEMLGAMEVDTERMQGLRMNDKAENEGSQIDFEVTAGRPSAGRSVGKLAMQLRDKRSRLMNGSLSKALVGAVMVVTSGTGSNHPTINWQEKERPKNSIVKKIETTLGVPWAVCVICLAIVAITVAYCLRSRLR